MSDYTQYMMWKFLAVCVLAFIWGFIRPGPPEE